MELHMPDTSWWCAAYMVKDEGNHRELEPIGVLERWNRCAGLRAAGFAWIAALGCSETTADPDAAAQVDAAEERDAARAGADAGDRRREPCAEPEVRYGEGHGVVVEGDLDDAYPFEGPAHVCVRDARGTLIASYSGHEHPELHTIKACVFDSDETESGLALVFFGTAGSDERYLLPPTVRDPTTGAVVRELAVENRFFAESGQWQWACDSEEPIVYQLVLDYSGTGRADAPRLEVVDMAGDLALSLELDPERCPVHREPYTMSGRGGVLSLEPDAHSAAQACVVDVRADR